MGEGESQSLGPGSVLKKWKHVTEKKFPKYDVAHKVSALEQDFLLITCKTLECELLNTTPAFQLCIQEAHTGPGVIIALKAFSGTEIATEETQSADNSKLLPKLGDVVMCPGIPRPHELDVDSILIEKMQSSIVYRSLSCLYAVDKAKHGSRCRFCESTSKFEIMPKLKSQTMSGSVTKVTMKPQKKKAASVATKSKRRVGKEVEVVSIA